MGYRRIIISEIPTAASVETDIMKMIATIEIANLGIRSFNSLRKSVKDLMIKIRSIGILEAMIDLIIEMKGMLQESLMIPEVPKLISGTITTKLRIKIMIMNQIVPLINTTR